MEGIKYVNLIEIGSVVIEIQRVENGELAVPVNNTLVRHTTVCLDILSIIGWGLARIVHKL